MARKTKDEALETRERILDAAEAVFQQKGVSRTSLNEIAAAASVTRGAIYWHFENKVDLFNALIERVCRPNEGFCSGIGALDGEEDPLGFLRRLALQTLLRLARDRHLQQVYEIVWHKCEYVDEMAEIRDRHLEGGHRQLAMAEEAMRRAQAAGRIAAHVDPQRAAVGLIALVDGLILNWTLDQRLFPLGELAEGIIDVYLAGLGASVPTTPAAVREALARS